MDFISIIIMLGMAQGLFVGIFLITKKSGNRRANIILGIQFFNFAWTLSPFLFFRQGVYLEFPHLLLVSFPFLFLIGPLFYFYLKLLTDNTFRFNLGSFNHFIPFLIIVLALMSFYMMPAQEKLDHIKQLYEVKRGDILDGLYSILQLCHIFFYSVLINKILARNLETMTNSFSSLDSFNLKWLKNGMYWVSAIFGLILLSLMLLLFRVEVTFLYQTCVPVMITIVIYIMGYQGLHQSDVAGVVASQDDESVQQKYGKSSLSDEMADEYLTIIKKSMEESRLYRDNELTLPKLAGILSIPSHHLSRVINERTGSNFFDFVNSYRVEEAKLKLTDPEFAKMTILGIAMESGFNSKSSFNLVFKKLTGLTPSEYKKRPES